MSFDFALINSTTSIDDAESAISKLWISDVHNNYIVMDELLDLIIDTKTIKDSIKDIKFEFSKHSKINETPNVLKQQKEIYSDSFVLSEDTQIKSVIGELFGCEYYKDNILRISTNGIFNKFIYPHLLPNDVLNIKLIFNNTLTVSHDYKLKSFVKLQVTDCLLKKLNKNVSTISVSFDNNSNNIENVITEWEITHFDFTINHRLPLPPVENIHIFPISCKNKESYNINYNIKWDDILKKLDIREKEHKTEYLLGKFSLEYKLKKLNRSFKLSNTTKYTKKYLLGEQLDDETDKNGDMNGLENDVLDIKLLNNNLTEVDNLYFITIPQGEVTKIYFKISKKLESKSKLKDLVIFQYFKKATVQEFKKFKGLSISLKIPFDGHDTNGEFLDGNNGILNYYKYNNDNNMNFTPLESEPMTRVSIPSTPGLNNYYQKQYAMNTNISVKAITNHVNEKYWQWKKSLRLLPYQCGLVLIDDDYQISFEENENSITVGIRIVGIQKGYYPNLSNLKLYDLNSNQILDFCSNYGVLCI